MKSGAPTEARLSPQSWQLSVSSGAPIPTLSLKLRPRSPRTTRKYPPQPEVVVVAVAGAAETVVVATSAETVVAAVEVVPIILEIIILLIQTSQTKIKAKEARSLIKRGQEPVLMSQTMRAPGTGRKAVLRLIVVTPSSAPGSTSLPLVRRPEKLASLVLEIQKST